MRVGGKTAAALLLAGLVLGVLLAKRHEILPSAPAAATRPTAASWLKVRELRILGPDGSVGLWIGQSAKDGPYLSITNPRKTSTIEAGVHGNGFPYLLVSDGAIRNFGLGRVDGAMASPILVFRSDDVVRMVFGLDMTAKHQSPFLVRYSADGAKHEVIGHYCDRPDRVCVQ
jgi:hypothetical protein